MTPPKTFVYGTFRWPTRRIGLPPPPSYLRPGAPDIAIEVLREFGATELRGKLYVRQMSSSWVPAQIDYIRSTPWYQFFEKNQKHVVFDMDGSGPWEVLYFRNESDETGTYVAVALRYMAEVPVWVQGQRKREAS
jgi:hypothetical protein